jgi:geranylgeranyl reductase family protein
MPDALTPDVLVVGAGPAGAAAAIRVARAGFHATLIDRYEFPRDKICGDALIPDALAALATLGLDADILPRARQLAGIRVYAPNGTQVTLSGRVASLPRRELDERLRAAAVESGAAFLAPLNVKQPLGGAVVEGAVAEHRQTKAAVPIRARVTILATGGGVDGLNRFGVVERREPSAVACRAYFRVSPAYAVAFDHLYISYDRSTAPGYGWVFPGPGDVFNVGVGLFMDDGGARRHGTALSSLWTRFTGEFAPAVELVRRSTQISPVAGAPLRTGMAGAKLWRPGLLVAGEAAGLTYSFSGEGIGKALASGIVAGDLAVDHLAGRVTREALGPAYAARLQEFGPRFRAYSTAQRWLGSPRFANFLAGRAARSPFVRSELEGLLNETSDPAHLFSLGGIVRSLFG